MSAYINSAQAQGFLLLTLPNCTLSTPSTATQTGTLALQCVTLDVPSESMPDRDVWLVLKLNGFELAVSPTQTINYNRSTHTYMFLPEGPGSQLVQLVVPPNPSNPASLQDLETMEVILSQYGVLHDLESSSGEKGQGESHGPKSGSAPVHGTEQSELKGRLVLMDEDDGEVVATLDQTLPIKEDKNLTASGHEKDPVVIDLPGDEEERAGRREAYAHPASPEEQDMLMKTAGLISRGIILATYAITSGMTSASNYYISRSTPNAQPVEFSPRARTNMRRIHKISGTAVTVTSKTTTAILSTLDHVAGRLSAPSSRGTRGSGYASPSQPQLAPSAFPQHPGSPGNASPSTPWAGTSPPPPPLPQKKPRLLNRLLASTDLLLSTLEHSAKEIIESGTDAVSASLGHKYGQDIGSASRMAGQSARNVGLVYIDVRGVGRRALLKKAGQAVVRARMGGRDVVLGPQSQAMQNGPPGPSNPQGFYPPTFSPTAGVPNQSTASLPAHSQVHGLKGDAPPPGFKH